MFHSPGTSTKVSGTITGQGGWVWSCDSHVMPGYSCKVMLAGKSMHLIESTGKVGPVGEGGGGRGREGGREGEGEREGER